MSEHIKQNQVMVALSANGCDVFRANVGMVHLRDEHGKFIRMFRTGLPKGFPDLFGFIKATNEIFFIEMKDDKGRPGPDQIRFHKHLMQTGTIHGIARNVEDALRIVKNREVGYGFNS